MSQLQQDGDPQQILERLANDITNKLLHRPTLEMRRALQDDDDERVRLLKTLLGND